MSIRKAVYSLLSGVEGDVYPMVAPQELTDSYVVFNMRRSPTRSQEGIAINEVELTLNIYGNSLSEAIELADTMYAGLEGDSGSYDTEQLMIANWSSEDGFYLDDLNKYVITQEYQLRFS